MNIQIDITDLFGEKTQTALCVAAKSLGYEVSEHGFPINVSLGDEFSISITQNEANIIVTKKVEVFRALTFLNRKDFSLNQTPCFKTLGFMLDVSRNAVLTITAAKELLLKMALMGFNMCMMYTEDVYEVENEPFFGYMRGRYSKKELKELDLYADALGIELVPCIQTLGHLENALKWGDLAKYRDTASVLLADDDAVYDFIERMIKSVSETFQSRRIHLGMDEAMDLGLGRYLQKNGYQNGFDIIKKHLDRVEQITKKYDLKPMMWSDMYFRLGSKEHLYYDEECVIPQKVIDEASANIDLVYWDYYHKTEEFYDDYIAKHHQFSANTIFAGGMWTWVGAAVNYPLFFKTSIPALHSCKKNHIQEVLLTAWGDNGAESNIEAFMPGLMVYAEYCYTGNYDAKSVKERFCECFDENIDAFLDIGEFDRLDPLEDLVNDVPNPSKFLFYEDPLIGLYDLDVCDLNMEEHYKDVYARFRNHAKTTKHHQLLFAFYEKMAEFLIYKSELSMKLYDAYQNKDLQKLSELIEMRIVPAKNSLQDLRTLWRKLWFKTNKAFGFEVIDIRLGGLEARLESCYLRINEYLNGTIDQIEELEEERIHILRGKNVSGLEGVFVWSNIVTASKI